MSARHSDTAKEIVLALIGKMRPGASFKRMLPDVVLAYGLIHRMLREVDDQEFAEVRELTLAFSDRPSRAKPYRPGAMEGLKQPQIGGALTDGKGGRGSATGRSYKGRQALDRGRR